LKPSDPARHGQKTPDIKGIFLTLEGGEGVGKSSLLAALVPRLTQLGVPLCQTQEPGGTPRGQALRALLQASKWPANAEFLLFSADRNLHVTEVVQPTLQTGTWVLCDRFVDSSRVYQGIAGGIERTYLESVSQACTEGLEPDVTLLLDCPVEVSMARIAARRLEGEAWLHYDQAKREFHEKVRAGFLALAAQYHRRIVVLDCTQPVEKLVTQVEHHLKERGWIRG
jgi:dTMP kinase